MTGYYWAYAAMFGLILVLCGGLFGLEVYAVWFRPAGDDTISEMTGYLFRAATRDGYHALITFMAAGLALAGFLFLWYPKHVRDLALSKKATADRRAARPVAVIVVQTDDADQS